MKQDRSWFVLADGGRARVVVRRLPAGFSTEREFASVDLHHASRDLGRDRPGRAQESGWAARHAIEPRTDPHRAAKDEFAAEVAAVLNDAGAAGEFDRLVLVAPAHFGAALRASLKPAIAARIGAELHKDLTNVPDKDLPAFIEDLI